MSRVPLLLLATSAVLLAAPATRVTAAGPPHPATSTVCLAACPAGDMASRVVVRDAFSMPVVNVDVELRLAGATLTDCNGARYANVGGNADGAGLFQTQIRAGGASPGGVQVWAGGVQLRSDAAVAGTDADSDGRVTLKDVALLVAALGTPNPAFDYNCDGNVDNSDQAVMFAHLNHACPGTVHQDAATPGGRFELIVPIENQTLGLTRYFEPGKYQAAVTGQLVLRLGPRLDPMHIECELVSLSLGSVGFATPTEESGQLNAFLVPSPQPLTATWDSQGGFSLDQPVPWLIGSSFADSAADSQRPPGPEHMPYPPEGDTLLVMLSGSIVPNGSAYDVSLQLQGSSTPATAPYLQIRSCNLALTFLGMLPAPVTCEKCFTMCVQPVVVSNDDGTQTGVSDQRLKDMQTKAQQIWDGCCIRLEFRKAIKINCSTLNNWAWPAEGGLGEFEKAVDKKLKQLGHKRPEDCVLAVFVAGGAGGPDGGGLGEARNGDFVAVDDTHGTDDCKTKRGDRALAHELGHVLGVPDRPANDAGGVMSSCAPTGTVSGSVANGSSGALAGECEAAHKATGKVKRTESPCFKVGEDRRKCDVKITCCQNAQ